MPTLCGGDSLCVLFLIIKNIDSYIISGTKNIDSYIISGTLLLTVSRSGRSRIIIRRDFLLSLDSFSLYS